MDSEVACSVLATSESIITESNMRIIKNISLNDNILDNIPENSVNAEGNLFQTLLEHRNEIKLPGPE